MHNHGKSMAGTCVAPLLVAGNHMMCHRTFVAILVRFHMPSKIAIWRNFLFRNIVVHLTRQYYVRVWGMDIGRGAHIARSAKLDLSNPQGIHIGEFTCIAFDAVILTHDFINDRHAPVVIGANCLIGARAVVMPGVTIGDHCIVGVGSIVMRNVPARSIVMGNPARVIETEIDTGPWGARKVKAPTPPQEGLVPDIQAAVAG
jgi:acetyltransferase-like isoleucine patch superfamily enzyme